LVIFRHGLVRICVIRKALVVAGLSSVIALCSLNTLAAAQRNETYRAVQSESPKGQKLFTFTLPQGDLSILVNPTIGPVAITLEMHSGEVSSQLIEAVEVKSGDWASAKTEDEWEAICVMCNAENGSGLYAVYRNGSLFGMLTIGSNGSIDWMPIAQP
jgi:hypothetical protein